MNEIFLVLKEIFLTDKDFYIKCMVVDIFIVCGATYISNHITRWKIVRWNLLHPNSPVFFDVKDTIWGFEVKAVLRPKEESATRKNTYEMRKKEANP